MSKNLIKIILVSILLGASFLRLWQLGSTPISPDWDEVALGYDAYSIIHTGRDEFGNFLPVVLRSFDDYKPALYTYLAIPPVLVFGLNTFATRLPSAIFGIISVLSVYFLVKELFRKFEDYEYKDIIPLFAAGLMAISPWHIQFSRIAFESNVGLSFNILTALFFLKSFKKPTLLSLSALCASLSIYAYQSEKVFTPLLVFVMLVIYFKDLIKIPKKYLLTAVIVGIVTISPMVFYIASNKEALLRAQATLAFSDKTTFLKNNINRLEQDRESNNIVGTILDNRRVLYLKTGIAGYLSHYNLNWLFVTGDINRHHAPGMGLLYIWELPFIFIGIYNLIFNKKLRSISKKSIIFIFSWFLIAPVPAAFTSGVPHAVRTLNFLPTFQIFASVGLLITYKFYKNIRYATIRIAFAFCFLLFVSLNIFYYLNQYFVQQNYFYAYDWQYGYEKVIPEIEKIGKNYSKIVVSDREPLDKSYMFFLFYLKYSPAEFQKIGQFSSGGFGNNHYFDKYEFRVIDWERDSKESGVLFIGTPSEFPENIETVKTIYYPDGKPAIKMVEAL